MRNRRLRTRGLRLRRSALALCCATALACAEAEDQPAPEPEAGDEPAAGSAGGGPDSIAIVLTRGEEAVVVHRALAAGEPRLRTALEALLSGPTEDERAAGLESWFSATTAGALRSVDVDSTGLAVVDFSDLRALIPNAASSTGSRLLLHQLNGTIFADSAVRTIEYRIDGSCDAFWDWLQYGCQTVTRTDATGGGS